MKRKILLLALIYCFQQVFAGSPTIIPEVNLSPDQNKGKKQNESVQTTHIDRKKIQQTPVTSVAELLKQQQSVVRVTNNSMDDSLSVFSIRGFGDNAVANSLIMVDGFPLTNPNLLAPNFNTIPLSDIERIDITAGSQGTLYGNQAVGGVVNIVTRHPEQLMEDAQLGYGSYDSQFYNLLMGDKDTGNGFFFKAFGFYNNSDNYRQHNLQNNDSADGEFGWDYSRGTVSFNIQTYDDGVQYPGGLTQAQYDSNPRQASDTQNFTRYHTNVYQLFNDQEINSDWILETRLSQRDQNADGFMFRDFNEINNQGILNPVLKGNIFNSKLLVGYEGIQSTYDILDPLEHLHANLMENDVYAQTEIPFWQKFKLTLGGRNAVQDNAAQEIVNQPLNSVDRTFVTEEGIAFDPNKNWQFFLRRDGNFSFPKATELTWLPPGQTTLAPQLGVSYEAGAEWDTDRQKAQLSIYRLQLNDEIAFDPTQTPANPFGAFTNFPETLRQGVTATEQYKVNSEITLAGQVNFVNPRFAAGMYQGNLIPAVPQWTDNIDFDYQFAPHWRTEYTALYTGSSFASDDIANAQKLPGYWLNNISLQYFLNHFNASIAVNNLFNQRYSVFTVFDLDTQALEYYPGAGRNYLLTVKAFL